MFPGTDSLSLPTLDVDGAAVRRALQAARAPAAAAAAALPDVRAVLRAARAACRELGVAPRPELLRPACLVRFAGDAWPARDFERCVLSCAAAHWLGAGVPFAWLERGPGVFRVLQACDAEAGGQHGGRTLHTADAWLRPPFQPEVLSWTCCANRAGMALGVVGLDGLLQGLPQGLREVAMQERFCHVAPGPGGEAAGAPRGLFWNSPHGTMGALHLARTRPARPGDVAALQVLRALDARAREQARWLQLQPGEVLFLDNHRALHAIGGAHGAWRMLRGQWRASLLALGNFAGTGVPSVFSLARASRPPATR